MTTIDELKSLHKTWCHGSHDGDLVLRAASELEALQGEVEQLKQLLKAAVDREDYFKSDGVKLRTQNQELREMCKVKDRALLKSMGLKLETQ